MSVAIERLDEGIRAGLSAHFLALPARDLCLRFGRALAPGVILAYVDRIDFDRDAVFGVRDERRGLIGVAHVAFEDDLAEVGLSVLPEHRSRGIASALFERASAHVRNRSVRKLVMRYLWTNAPIMRIAQRFGMKVVANAGEADARLVLPPPSLASRAGEILADAYGRVSRKFRPRAPCS